MESTVRAMALQIQRHQMSIEIAKGRILHVTLLIILLTYEGMDTSHVEVCMHIAHKQTRDQRKCEKQRKGQKCDERETTGGDNLMGKRRKRNTTQDKTPI